jgi:hypothetical protein
LANHSNGGNIDFQTKTLCRQQKIREDIRYDNRERHSGQQNGLQGSTKTIIQYSVTTKKRYMKNHPQRTLCIFYRCDLLLELAGSKKRSKNRTVTIDSARDYFLLHSDQIPPDSFPQQ